MSTNTAMETTGISPSLARPAEILLVEDSPGDVRLMQEALREGKVANRVHVVRDGVEAMDFVRQQGDYADVPRPDIILLDLNLPKKDGRQVLAELKADDDLHRIPVVVLTTSRAEEDVLRAYDLHANCYMTKPVDLGRFLSLVKNIEHHWLVMVRLPQE
ncbi:MAG: response regulator [Planctomycetota bacterium]|nr:response regulator [Planctomycetota bacterium]